MDHWVVTVVGLVGVWLQVLEGPKRGTMVEKNRVDCNIVPLTRLLSFYVLVCPFLCGLQGVSHHLVTFFPYTNKFLPPWFSACG